jgi:hypothetical protein
MFSSGKVRHTRKRFSSLKKCMGNRAVINETILPCKSGKHLSTKVKKCLLLLVSQVAALSSCLVAGIDNAATLSLF